MAKDPDRRTRDAAVVALGHIESHPREVVAVLTQTAKGGHPNAIFALGRLAAAKPEAVTALIELLKDENRVTRRYALQALQQIPTPEAKEAVDNYKKQNPQNTIGQRSR